jgi:hypothetical protein
MLTCLLSDDPTQLHALPAFEHVNSPGRMDPVPKDVTRWSPPILRATDQAVGHSGYTRQTGTYAGCNPGVKPVDTSGGPYFVLGTLGVGDFSPCESPLRLRRSR